MTEPFLKWVGGKRSTAEAIEKLLPKDYRTRVYREPFLGGGAMFFRLRPERAVLSDVLRDLVTAYVCVRDELDEVLDRLRALDQQRSGGVVRRAPGQSRIMSEAESAYYGVRELFNARRERSPAERGAWLIYMNKTGFNGLYRTNKSGGFNVPFGDYAKPDIVAEERLRAASAALQGANISCEGFECLDADERLASYAKPGELVYMDPPYVPVSKTSDFSGYHEGSFGPEQQKRLAETFRKLDARGCLLALSQSETPVVRDLYAGYDIQVLQAPRAVNSKATGRGKVSELLIRNLARYP